MFKKVRTTVRERTPADLINFEDNLSFPLSVSPLNNTKVLRNSCEIHLNCIGLLKIFKNRFVQRKCF